MNFSVTVLGSSSALPTSTRFLTAHLLNSNERFFLIDCGEGTQIQLRKYHIRFSKINHIFISHLHGDHYFGLFGLISSFALLGRKIDLHIFAHSRLQEILEFQFKDYSLGFNLLFHAIQPDFEGILFEDKQITVHTFPLKHRIASNGFVFKEKQKDRNILKEMIPYYKLGIKEIVKIKKGEDFITPDGRTIPNNHLTKDPPRVRSYAFCSDTVFDKSIVKHITGVDLLYHESTFLKADKERAHQTGHSTSDEAALIAKLAGVRKLIIGHFSSSYKDLSVFEREAKEIFAHSEIVTEGKTFQIE
ncbi:MAG: ribonuclease Z [Bacteroidales bacterium]